MLNDLIALRNKLQPKLKSNTDSIQYDYNYWTEVERLAKKHRADALKIVQHVAGDKAEQPGIIIRGGVYKTRLVLSKPRKQFDKEVFISLIKETFPDISAATLRELATQAVVDGNKSKTYTVLGIDEDDD